jgi:hypothetical protein
MSTKRSQYEQLLLESNNQSKSVDIRLGTYSIDYYEDIFSPTVTAKILVMDTGDSIVGENGLKQSVYNGLPLRGGERLSLKIAGNSPTNQGLDFSKPENYLYVSSISNVISQSQREIFQLHLVSREAITNETTRVGRKFPTGSSIDTSVSAIIKDYLKTTRVGTIDKTSNTYGFIGNLRKPFTVLVSLASKSVPDGGIAGFFFYQTQDGFQFRAIDNLIKQTPKATYTYTQVNQAEFFRNNDKNIIDYSTERNQNLLEKLRLGTYASYRTYYDPLTFNFTPQEQAVFKADNYVNKLKNLGQELEIPNGLGNIPTRIMTHVLDIGTMEKDVSTKPNANPSLFQSQSMMRYNVLFLQTVNMMVPLNTNLKAGDIIECNLPKISQSDKNVFDEQQSGLYMIKELCHHFDLDGSYTSMKLVRDTFGKHGKNNK